MAGRGSNRVKKDQTGHREHDASSSAPLAIIGIGSLFPKASDLESFWANIKNGVDAITEVPSTHWNPEDYYSDDPKKPDFTYGRRGGFIPPQDFDPLKYGIPPNSIEATDTSQLLGMAAAEAAMQDAGYGTESEFDRDRVSVILGVTGTLELVIPLGARLGHPKWRKAMLDAGVDPAVTEDAVQRIADSYVPWQENSFPGLLGNVVAGRISKHLNTGGTNCVVDAACASSMSAIHLAAMELSTGKADMVITGGIDTFNDIFMYMCFSKTPALSPTGDARPFHHEGDGTILGEGLGLIVLKRLEDAERDGNTIYAVLKGVGSSSDGKGDAIYAPSSPGQVKALRAAYAAADVSPDSIELVEAHGTGTAKGDAVEAAALNEVYDAKGDRPWCALGSVKSQIGHTKAAAGSAGIIKAAMALHNKVLPPTLKVDRPLDEVAPGASAFYVNTLRRPWVANAAHPRRAGVSSFGFGGSNFHAVLEEYGPKKTAPDWDGKVQIIALSAPKAEALATVLADIPAEGDWDAVRAAASESCKRFDRSDACRLLLVAECGVTDLKKLIASATSMLTKNSTSAWSTPDGAYYAYGDPEGSIAFLFPGQGAQSPGMLRDLSCTFPEMLEALALADEVYAETAALSDCIYPHPAFDDDTKAQHEATLRATDVAQPSIGAVSLGACEVLKSFGVHPTAVAGHSYGELTALFAAGRLDAASFLKASVVRGRLMAECAGGGAMLAVRATVDTIEAAITKESLDVIVANKNAPEQAVLSGPTDEIDRAKQTFDAQGIASTKLAVAAAFHSESVAGASGPFIEVLEELSFGDGNVPVYSNTTGAEYPADVNEARQLLAAQLARPVEFVAEIEALYAAGARTFVEVGPGARLTGLVAAILGDRSHQAISVDASSGKRSGITDLARTLALVAARGHEVALTKWDSAYESVPDDKQKKPRLVLPISGANYRSSQPKERPPVPAKKAVAAKPQPAPAQPSERPVAQTKPSTTQSAPSPRPVSPETAPLPAAPSATPQAQGGLPELLRQTQANIAALHHVQEQTARLHGQFLEGQAQAAQTFQALLAQHQQLFQAGATGLAAPAPPTFAQPPAQPVAASPISEPAPTAPTPAPEVAPIAQEPAAASPLQGILLDIVAEKTGYPSDMLELGMSLDADLGIDSIKRVEILSALQEQVPELPTVQSESLGAIQTLGDIVALLEPAGASAELAMSPEASDTGRIHALLFEVIAEKTGYPADMLELDMSLDSDLGIDSIKRVEILSAIQEEMPELPSVEAEVLGGLQTLRDVVEHLDAHAPATAGVAPAADQSKLQELLLGVIAEKTGYPADMLELDMSLDADLGIDSIKRVEILSAVQEQMPELPSLEAEALGALQTLRDVMNQLGDATAPATPTPSPIAQPTSAAPAPRADRAIYRGLVRADALADADARGTVPLRDGAVLWIAGEGDALSDAIAARLAERGYDCSVVPCDPTQWATLPERLDGLVVVSPETGASDDFLKSVFGVVQAVSDALRTSAKESAALLATVSRLDGRFGLAGLAGDLDPISGGLAGLTKTASHEWTGVRCKAIDLSCEFEVAEAATRVTEELLKVGPLEVGIAQDGLYAPSIEPVALPAPNGSVPLTADDVVVITGGARGVTAEIAVALAERFGCTPVLLGRSPAPQAEADWLASLTDERAIKRALHDRANGNVEPKQLETAYRAIAANREILRTIERVEATGARAVYGSVDVRDAGTISTCIAEVEKVTGPITGLIHGAGVLADRKIEDKTAEQFSSVYDTKVLGLRNFLDALDTNDLKLLVLFSSSTARFGRTGQVDYAMANEVLNKIAQRETLRRPNARVLSINWGPWAGGMVTPSLEKVFEREGVGLIGLEEGAGYLLDEIGAGQGDVAEIVVMGSELPGAVSKGQSDATALSPVFEIEIDAERYSFLKSHVMDGKAVLPVAIYIEWFAHAALHGNPGLRFQGVDDLHVYKGVVLESEESRQLKLYTAKARKHEEGHAVTVEMRSAGANGRDIIHARAEVVLGTKPAVADAALGDLALEPYSESGQDMYCNGTLFHGETFCGIQEITGCDRRGIRAICKTAPSPSKWIDEPLRKTWIADPLVLDSAFQMMILWSFDQNGIGSLPCFIGRYRQCRATYPKGKVDVTIHVKEHSEHRAIATIEFLNPKNGKLIARIDDYECVIDEALNTAFQRNQLTQESLSR